MSQESALGRAIAPPVQRKKRSLRTEEAWLGWLLVLPALLVILGMVAYPFFEANRISFTDRMIGRGAGQWVGFENYE